MLTELISQIDRWFSRRRQVFEHLHSLIRPFATTLIFRKGIDLPRKLTAFLVLLTYFDHGLFVHFYMLVESSPIAKGLRLFSSSALPSK